MAETKDKFRFVGGHPEDLGTGRVAEVDQEVSLSAKDLEEPTVVRLIEEGKLIPLSDKEKVEEPQAPETPPKTEEQPKKAGKGTGK